MEAEKVEALRMALRRVTSTVEKDFRGETCNEDYLLFTVGVTEL